MKRKFKNDSMPAVLYNPQDSSLYFGIGSYRSAMRKLKRNPQMFYVGSGAIRMENLLNRMPGIPDEGMEK